MHVKQGELLGTEDGVHAPASRRAARVAVRAPVVARNRDEPTGSEGVQEGGTVTDATRERRPAPVPAGATQAGDIRARWAWVEPTVWTYRMLTALEQGVKGAVWFSLVDKV